MGMARKLKNINAYADGESFLGIVSEFTEPKLTLSTEDLRNGGMLGPVKIDNGLEAMEAEIVMSGHTASLIRKFGETRVDGVRIRLVAAYQADDGTAPQAVEVYMGGRFTEIDLGKAKPGDATEHKFKLAPAYYRRVVDGVDEIEIDMLAGVFITGGVDRYGEIMSIISS